MTPFKCFKLYLALKRHFDKTNYNFIKYKGRMKVSQDTFEARNDRHLFTKLADQKKVPQLILSNLVHDPSLYVTDFLSSEGQDRLRAYIKYQESFDYSFMREIKQYDTIGQMVKVRDGEYPAIVTDWLSGKVSIDTLSVIDKVINGTKYWSESLSDPLWDDINRRLLNYRPFTTTDVKHFKAMIKDYFS